MELRRLSDMLMDRVHDMCAMDGHGFTLETPGGMIECDGLRDVTMRMEARVATDGDEECAREHPLLEAWVLRKAIEMIGECADDFAYEDYGGEPPSTFRSDAGWRTIG